nr:hypothetical protein [uncultured Brumimicrobium sp.]
MKNSTYIKVLFVIISMFIISTSVAQIDTPEKRLTRINFLHEKIFQFDNDSSYLENAVFVQIKEGRDSIAVNYPITNDLRQSEFSLEAHQWEKEHQEETDSYITYLEIFIRKRRL